MVYALCNKSKTESAILELEQIICNVQSILSQLIDEQIKSDKFVKSKRCRLQKKSVNSFEYFTYKGMMCLYMVNQLLEWNRKSRTMFGWLMRNIDVYTRLRKEFEKIKYNIDELTDKKRIHDENFIIFSENDIRFQNDIFVNIDIDNVIEFEVNEAPEFYGWLYEVDKREGLLIGIEFKFNEVQDTFFKRYFLLYHELNDYCTELRQYLNDNKHTLKSCKLYRKKNLVCCKYHSLKRLLKQINEKEKHIAKYDAAYQGNRWN